jgi:uncharacterized protein DUF4145
MGKVTKKYTLAKGNEEGHKFICKECCRETSHSIISSYSEAGYEDCGGGNGVDWDVRNQIIQCLGCEAVSFRVISTFSEDYDYDQEGKMVLNETVKYYPGRSEGLKAISSYLLPENVQCIYKETILAIENEQNVLAGIGIRALIETICKDLKAEGKDLYNKINDLKEKSIVTNEGVDTLHKLRVLGNDAAHEVKEHNKQQLSVAIQIIEHMLDGTYIIPHKVAEVFQ